MLRVRRGAGLSANLSHICHPYLRCAHQCLPRRSFATKTDSDSGPEPQPSSAGKSEDVLNGLDASSKKLRTRIREMKKGADKMKTRKALHNKKEAEKKTASRKTKAGGSDKAVKPEGENDFEGALDVVRKVYGVEGSDKPSTPPSTPPSKPPRKSKRAPRRTKKVEANIPDKAQQDETLVKAQGNETLAKDSDAGAPRTWTIAQQAGLWTSLREKLQHQTQEQPKELEDEQDQMYQYAQQDLSLGPDATSFISNESPSVPTSFNKPPEPIPEFPAVGLLTKGTKGTKKPKKQKSGVEINVIHPRYLKLQPIEGKLAADVPKLEYNLDKVLFNPGVYQLQDKRSKVFNFDPYLATIMPVEQFDFNALKEYVTSSKDTRLRDLSAKHGKKFCGSTSSMTSMLAHFHFLLSAWRKPSFEHLSRSFDVEYESFTQLSRGPAAAFARYKDGVYAIDADKEYDTANILSMLGKSMEKLLTLPRKDFEKYRRTQSHKLSEEEKNAEEAFHYSTFGDFMLRSQLDAYDPRLPGTGMFDLKTRAVVSIRMDVGGYEKGVGYEIRNRFGTWESFEREYYDMIRAAFLKYSLQVRMGRMDGIFVAFHNTQRIFGFQYISLEEMDRALHGTSDRSVGDQEFRASLTLLNDVLDRASKRFPGRSLRLHIETRPTNPPLTYFFAEPVDEDAITKTQETGRASVEAFEREILGLSRQEKEEESRQLKEELVAQVKQEQLDQEDSQDSTSAPDPQRQKAWDEMMAKVDDTVENDSLGLQTVRDAIEQALEQSGLLAGNSEMEKNAYLNALVEALAEELSDVKDLCKEPEDVPQSKDEGAQPEDLEKANETTQEGEETPRPDGLTEENASRDIDSKQSGSQSAAEETPEPLVRGSEVVADETPTAVDATSTEEGSTVVDSPSLEGSKTFDATSTEGSNVVDSTSAEDGSAVVDAASITEGSNDVNTRTVEIISDAIGDAIGDQAGSAANSELPDVPLKDLILRVAQSVDHKTSSMGTFERVLSDLVQAQKQATAEIDEADEVDEADEAIEGESELTPLEEATATGTSPEPSEVDAASAKEKAPKKERELLGMYITVRNTVDDQVVERVEQPENPFSQKPRWAVEYTVTELPQERAQRILRQLRSRRKKILQADPEERTKQWHRAWAGGLARTTAAGEKYRKGLNRRQKGKGVKVAWSDKQLPPTQFTL
ncbi:hypothetical protein ACHAPT_003456 [Fusarium lateritium]